MIFEVVKMRVSVICHTIFGICEGNPLRGGGSLLSLLLTYSFTHCAMSETKNRIEITRFSWIRTTVF